MSRKCPECGSVYPDTQFFCGEDGKIVIQELPPGEHDRRLGERLGDYIVVARVADGAMGRVFEGRHVDTKARVAVKVLHDDVARDQVAVERFKRESETARELSHENVVKVIDFGQTPDGSYFMTMEFLEGEELGNLLRRDGAVDRARAVRILSQIAIGLDHAHSFGVIHRDLKPDNIFLCRSDAGDVVRLLDFGSVKLQMETGPKLTAFGTTLGSPYYMSPEQAMGKADVDQRTDIFACTGILYEMLTGKIAFEASNLPQILMRIMNEHPAPPSSFGTGVPVSVDDVVEKGLRKDKLKRYGSAGELASAFIASLGLTGNHLEWAHKPQHEIEAALANAKPAEPKPFGVESLPPGKIVAPVAAAPVAQTSPLAHPGASSFEPAASAPVAKGANKAVWLVVGVVALVAALAAAFFATR